MPEDVYPVLSISESIEGERPRPARTMDYNQNTWQLARLMLEQRGQHAMHGARAVSACLRDVYPGGSDATCHEVVRAMDFLLSDEGSGTIH